MIIKKSGIIFIFLVLITCKQQPKQVKKDLVKLPTTEWIQEQINNYDSIYGLYSSVEKITPAARLLLQQSHYYLDSVLMFEKVITNLKDTSLIKLLLKALYYKGTDLSDIDNFSEAEKLLNKYLVIHHDMHLPASPQSAYVHKTIADIYTRLGDHLQAMFHKRQSLEYYVASNDYINIASEAINIGITLREKQLFDSSINYLKKGISLPSVKTNRLLTMYTELAKNYLAKNNPVLASLTLQQGCVYFNLLSKSKSDLGKYEEKNLDRLADFNSTMADLYMGQKKFQPAVILLKQSLAFYHAQYGDEKKREIGKTYNELGKAYQLLLQKDSAIHCFNMALWSVANIDTNNIFAVPEKNKVYAENTIIESLEQKAKWMVTYYPPESPIKYLRCAVNCYDVIMEAEYKLLQYFSYDDSKLQVLKESRRRSEQAITTCYKLYLVDKNNDWVDNAFRFAEQNKSYILLESLKRNLQLNLPTRTGSPYLELQQAQLNYANCEKAWIAANNTTDRKMIYKAEITLENADKLLQVIKSRLRFSSSEYNTLLEKQESMAASAASKLLPGPNTALVEYFIGDSTSYSFYISAAAPAKMFRLSDSLQNSMNDFLAFFTTKNDINKHPRTFNKAAYNLCTYLGLNKIDEQVNNLIIIPDDRLSFVTFDALVTEPLNSLSLSSFNYLVKRFEISYGYSAATLLKQSPGNSGKGGIAVFTPVFTQNPRGLSSLQFSARETQSIKNIYQEGKYFENGNATVQQFKTNAPFAEIIHIASHASALGTPHIEFYDSALYLGEIYAMHLQANLVVLSGCETGIGKIEKSEGAISLARGFYYAGAQHIITSLWNVDDNSTAQLFTEFYRNLQKENYSKALRQSKLSYLNSGISNNKCSPYYWAGFIHIGVNSKPAGNLFYTYLLIAAIVIVFVFSAKYFYKKVRNNLIVHQNRD